MKRFAVATATILLSLVTSTWADGIADHITVELAVARAVAPGAPVGGAYMQVTNGDDTSHALVAARSDIAEHVELHNHVMEDGMMKMRRMDSVPLPAGETVTFEPGGLHVMLIGLTAPLEAGGTFEIELQFEDDSRRSVTFDIR